MRAVTDRARISRPAISQDLGSCRPRARSATASRGEWSQSGVNPAVLAPPVSRMRIGASRTDRPDRLLDDRGGTAASSKSSRSEEPGDARVGAAMAWESAGTSAGT